MSEGHVSGPAPRLRIKGKWQSVVRFFSISVAFMVLWILVTSQLGHYSKLFGPQILLQLNLAFYIPSIPVLLLSGSLERALDERLGPIGSIAARLNGGLAGCLAVAAVFPVLPGLRPGDGPLWPLLSAVGVLGGLSAVAFSTSYQLVQFFRAADTIGLGVGCVGAGPLVLLVQLGLGVGPSPARWQWIAMYEISAGFIAAGLASSSSLCGQYWNQLNQAAPRNGSGGSGSAGGSGGAEGPRVPLLAAADADATAAATAAAAADAEAAWPGLELASVPGGAANAAGGCPASPSSPYGGVYIVRQLSAGGGGGSGALRPRGVRPGSLRRRPTTAPDPFNIFSLLTPGLDGGFDWGNDDDDDDGPGAAPPVLLRRSASMGVEDSARSVAAAARRREALAAAGLGRPSRGRTGPGARAGGGGGGGGGTTTLYSQYVVPLPAVKPNTPPSSPAPAAVAVTAATPGAAATPPPPPPPTQAAPLLGMASAPAKMVRRPAPAAAAAAAATAATPPPQPAATPVLGGILEFGVPDEEPVASGAAAGAVATPPPPPHNHHHHQHKPSYGTGASSFATSTASELLTRALGVSETDGAERAGGGGSAVAAAASPLAAAAAALSGSGSGAVSTSVGTMTTVTSTTAMVKPLESLEEAAVVTVGVDGKDPTAAEAEAAGMYAGPPMTMREEVVEVVKSSWQVLLGFTVDVTLLYIVFPFFTYVPPSGWLGDSLPQVLFYARLFTDLAGRLLPRRRALQLRSGAAVLCLAALSTAAAALFFAYILAPPHLVARAPRLLRNDAVPLGLVVFLWLTGGYTNTMSNMLAPSLAPPALAGRASALMALLFNVGHIGGLLVAATMAAAIFGDVVG